MFWIFLQGGVCERDRGRWDGVPLRIPCGTEPGGLDGMGGLGCVRCVGGSWMSVP